MKYFILLTLLIPLMTVAYTPSNDKITEADQIRVLNSTYVTLKNDIDMDSNNIFGIANLTATGTTTLNTSLTGPLKAASGVISASDINLTSEVTGVLPIANGGTNSSAALNNDRIMVSSGDSIVESSTAMTNGDLFYWNSSLSNLGIGTEGQVLEVSSGLPAWTDPPSSSPTTTIGDIIINTLGTSGGDTRLAIGSNTQILRSNGVIPEYADIDDTLGLTTKGDLLSHVGGANGSSRLGVGSNGQILSADSSESTGLKWIDGGTGSGGINYLSGDDTNGNNSVGSWATYADAAGENAVDGTGGSATTTFTQNTTTPLRDAGDFKLAKDAASRQGEGASIAFTIDKADQSQMLTISFDYDTSDSDYADDDIRIQIYDVTNANLIRINGEDLKGGKGVHVAEFQAAADSTSYRLILHVSSTNAAAYDVYFDNILVGPSAQSVGGANEVIAEGAGNGGTSITANTTNIDFTETRDTSASFDGTTFTAPETGEYAIDGSLYFTTSPTNVRVDIYVDTVLTRTIGNQIGSGNVTPFSGSISLTKGEALTVRISQNVTLNSNTAFHWLKITKLGISDEATSVNSGREIYAVGSGNGGTSITADVTNIDFTETSDSTASFDGTTFTAPETGMYTFEGSVQFTAAVTTQIDLYVNASQNKRLSHSLNATQHYFSGMQYLNKGDAATLRSIAGGTLSNSFGTLLHNLVIAKIPNPQTPLDTSTVAARYTTDAGQTVNTGVTTDIVFEDLEEDTHNAYNTSTGVYTVPVSGWYMISTYNGLTGRNVAASTTRAYTQILFTGTYTDAPQIGLSPGGAATAYSLYIMNGTIIRKLAKGDTFKVQMNHNSGSNDTLNTSGTLNYLQVAKIK